MEQACCSPGTCKPSTLMISQLHQLAGRAPFLTCSLRHYLDNYSSLSCPYFRAHLYHPSSHYLSSISTLFRYLHDFKVGSCSLACFRLTLCSRNSWKKKHLNVAYFCDSFGCFPIHDLLQRNLCLSWLH